MANLLTKVFRFVKILGLKRTFVKICGRKRLGVAPFVMFHRKKANIGFIGCGQFPFSTIGYFIYDKTRNRIRSCFDINRKTSETLAKFYHAWKVADKVEEIFHDPQIDTVYIASDHFSHTPYALQALASGKNIHIEKPVSVNWEQFEQLRKTVSATDRIVVAGYNRPFAEATKIIINELRQSANKPISLNCFVIAHNIPPDHWYRLPCEGSRICGNVGHWLDLAVHFLVLRGHIPVFFTITLNWADKERDADDNFIISMSTDEGDIISITLTSRSEPLEGITEMIQLQSGDVHADIFDFRELRLWHGSKYVHKKFHPKDVGHKESVLQVLDNTRYHRDWNEVLISTYLMLTIKDMADQGCATKKIKIPF